MEPVDESSVLAAIDAALAGDRKALSQVLQLSKRWIVPIVHRFKLRGADADDAIQEVYAHLLVALHKFDRRSKFSTWIYRVTSNIIIVHLRRFKAHAQRHLHEEVVVAAPSCDEPERLLLDKLDILALRLAIAEAHLEDSMIEQLDRFYGESESISTIAESHGLSENALRKRMFIARRKLQELLEERRSQM